MQFKTLLVLLPALISAAPVAPGTAMANPSVDVPAVAEFTESRADGANIFAREATCNAPEPRSNTKEHEAWKKYMDKMREATRNAHTAEEGCDWDGWRDAMNPALKERLKKECITAYKGFVLPENRLSISLPGTN